MPPAFGAILQGSLFGLAGLLPTSYTAPIMSGQGLAGFFASVAMICAIASKSSYYLPVGLVAGGKGQGWGWSLISAHPPPRWLGAVRKCLWLFYHGLWGYRFGHHLLPRPAPTGKRMEKARFGVWGGGSRASDQWCSETQTWARQEFWSFHH